MFLNFLKVAFRNLVRQKGYTVITIVGLAAGVAAFLLIGLWVQDQLSYDRFHEKGERIYRAIWDAKIGDNEWKIPLVPVPLGDALRSNFPGVESVVRLRETTLSIRKNGMLQREENVVYAEPTFFDVFTVHFLSGNPSEALQSMQDIVLTRPTAMRYFGTVDAIGKTLVLSDGSILRVSAIVEPFPPQAHFHFSILAPIDALPIIAARRTQWGSATVRTYVLLKDESSLEYLQINLQDYINRNVNPGSLYSKGTNRNGYRFQPIFDIHLHPQIGERTGFSTPSLFMAIGVFILLLACINFVNLFTARSSRRAKEVGVRKVIGSGRKHLIFQFLLESFLVVVSAVWLAILFVEIALPGLNQLTGKQLVLHPLDPGVTGVLLLLIFVLTLLSGLYPAFVLSSFVPARALKGQFSKSFTGNRIRTVLVVFQFCTCILLMIGTMVVHEQLTFMLGKQLGFDREHVLVVHNVAALRDKLGTFKNELEKHAAVSSVSMVQTLPGYGFDSNLFEPEQPSNYKQTSLSYDVVDEDFVDALGLTIVKGRNFSRNMPTDSSAYVINQAAANALGWKEPIGKTLYSGANTGPVIGVVEDFNYESLQYDIRPIVFMFNRWTRQLAAIRFRPGNIEERVDLVRKAWQHVMPERSFEYSFLDQDYEELYRDEQKLSQVFGMFAGLSLIIACLGLFALAAYTVEQRTKEIGIRKVLGVSAPGVAALLSREFVLCVLLAGIIAFPLAHYAMNRWLQHFAYRIDLGIGIFLLAGLGTLAISLLTVSYQSIKAALSNPVKALRYE